jgi:hypothetical protein
MQVPEGELAVFFRNNHFSTLLKHGGRVFLLLTDLGFGSVEHAVWEQQTQVEGDNPFFDGDFRPFLPARSPAAAPPSAAPAPAPRPSPSPPAPTGPAGVPLRREFQKIEEQRRKQQQQLAEVRAARAAHHVQAGVRPAFCSLPGASLIPSCTGLARVATGAASCAHPCPT